MQQRNFQHFWSSTLLRRRVGVASGATCFILMISPQPMVLVALSLLVWPLGVCEWRSARRVLAG